VHAAAARLDALDEIGDVFEVINPIERRKRLSSSTETRRKFSTAFSYGDLRPLI
jgi:hypothetical protein